MRCAIHSAENGSLMIIPRENKMVRLYIQLKEVTPDATGRADRSKITPDLIFRAAQKIISPYKLDYEYCDWWTGYQVSSVNLISFLFPLPPHVSDRWVLTAVSQIGQRVCTNFDAQRRVFLAGDAVHTHSPKGE